MARAFIGIDIDDTRLRLVALEETGNEQRLSAVIQRELASADEAAGAIATILEQEEMSNARMATALAAGRLLSRRLSFPFGDRKKIAAAVPLELGSRLPLDLADHFVVSLPPAPDDGKFATTGFAIPTDLVASTLEPFDERQLPLRHLGVLPYCCAGRLAGQPATCILVLVRSDEAATLLIREGEPVAHRVAARRASAPDEEIAGHIRRDVVSLQKSAGLADVPVLLLGGPLGDELEQRVRTDFPDVTTPQETFEDGALPAEFLPALTLARLAAAPGRSLNLRQGRYAFRGNLAPFRKQLIAAAMLVVLTIASLAGGGWLSYARKAGAIESLEQRMAAVYSQTFPQSDVPKDVMLHMESRLNEARRQSRTLGGPGYAPLPVLETISRALPEGTETVIRELNYDKDGVRLAGRTRSFDDVDKLAANLNAEAAFKDARISDAKTSLDGKRVDFRIELSFDRQGGR